MGSVAIARAGFLLGVCLVATACGPLPEGLECAHMRQIGNSPEKLELIGNWIETVLAEPQALSSSISNDGLLRPGGMDPDLDWAELGIPDYRATVEFFGESLDLGNIDPEGVEAVMVGFRMYRLVFKRDPNTRVEEKLVEESKKPYHNPVRLEALSPTLTLACQVNNFG